MRLSILAFALGVLVLQMQPTLPSQSICLLALVLSCAVFVFLLIFQKRSRHRSPCKSLFLKVLLFVAAGLIGFSWAAMRADIRLAERLPAAFEGRDIEVVGVVAEMPQAFSRGLRFSFDVEHASLAEGTLPSRVMLSWYHTDHAGDSDQVGHAEKIRPGERWRLTVRLKRPHGNANPHGFDYEAWLLERDIGATGYVRPKASVERLQAFVWSVSYVVERLRDDIRNRFLNTLSGESYAGVLVALAVGDQRAIQGDFWRVFSRTGTTHLMSISGLHVTMVAALLAALVNLVWRRSQRLMLFMPARRAAICAGWLGALAYALLAGFSVPAQRTVFMLTVAALALLLGRRTSASRTLSVALGLVLLVDPWAVLSPGFWLSFGAVSLLFFTASERIGNETNTWRGVLASWGAAQWAVTVGSIPLLLLFFQQFSVVSPIANALAIPAISFVVTPLVLLAVVVPLPLLLHLDHWLLSLVMEGLTWLSTFPVHEQPAPPLWAVVLGLLGVVWLLLPRGIPSRWLGLLLLAPAILIVPARPSTGQAWVTVLDVGQGLAVVVQTETKTLLYDTGPLYSAESDAGQRVVLPYLRAIGVRQLDAMVVTHSDTDHSGGAASVLAAIPVSRVLSSVTGMTGEACAAGQQWEWEGVSFSMLHPLAETGGAEGKMAERREKPNNRSCVLRIEAGGNSILLSSDIEAIDERALLEREPDALKSDVLLVPHHGSKTSSTPAFIAAVSPSQVIYPVGYRNRFKHPRPEVVNRYGELPSWRSDEHGAITVRLGGGVEVESWRQRHSRYWHAGQGVR